MTHRAWWTAGAAIVGAIVVVVATTVGTVPLWHDAEPRAERAPSPTEAERSVDSVATVQLRDATDGGQVMDLGWLVAAVAAALVAALVALIVWRLARMRWRWPSRRRAGTPGAVPLPAVAETVRDAEAELQAALQAGSARNSIVRCWIRLEQAVAAAGVARRPSETSHELTTRVLTELTVDDASIRGLGALYREARFSRHELGEPHRQAAIASLNELLGQLDTTRFVDREPVP